MACLYDIFSWIARCISLRAAARCGGTMAAAWMTKRLF
jgi:hypothetical protein